MQRSGLTEALRETLRLFEGGGDPLTTTEVADRLDLGRRSTYERLERLVDRGRLDTKLVGGNGRVWWRPRPAADVTDRKERERRLREQVRQQAVVAELGQRALENGGLDELMAEASALVAETLDNDYCKVLDLDREAGELLLRQGVGWRDGIVGSATISAHEDDSQAAYTLASNGPVRVTDLGAETRFSGPALLTDHDVRSGISVVIGPADDPWGILGTHDTEPGEIAFHDANFVQSVANILATAIDRHEHERRLVHQREQVAALNHLNQVVRDITDAVIDQSSREEIEATVCERLAASDSYLFAWVGDVDVDTQTVTLRTEAGVEGYLDDIVISVDPDDERSKGATGRALLTGEMQTTGDLRTDDRYGPWRGTVEEYGFRSSAAIPIVHEETVYGALNVYAERPDAFEGREREVLAQLGEVVGHAIAAAERKRALLNEEVVELEFHVRDVLADVGVDRESAGPITFDHVVPLGAGGYLVFGTTPADSIPALRALADAIPYWDHVAVTEADDGTATFEIRLTDPPLLSALSTHGGRLGETVIEDGHFDLTVHVPPDGEVKSIIEAIREVYPSARLQRRTQTTRQRGVSRVDGEELLDGLTDRQRTALETAYYAGFFEWPRESNGEEVAESLDISAPTFHQHLRAANRKVLRAVLSMPGESA